MPYRAGGGCRVRHGAGVRRTTAALRASPWPARASSRSTARRARHRVRPEYGGAARSVPGWPGRSELVGRCRRRTAADLRRGRRSVARPDLSTGPRVRGASSGGRVGSHDLCGARIRGRAGAHRSAGVGGARTGRQRCPRAAEVGPPGSVGRADARSDRRRDVRQPTGPARAAARHDARGARRRVRAARRPGAAGSDRGHVPAALGAAPTGDPTAAAGGGGRAGWRSSTHLARGRPARRRGRSGGPGGRGRTHRVRRPGAVQTSTGALRGLPGGGTRGSAERPPGPRRRH